MHAIAILNQHGQVSFRGIDDETVVITFQLRGFLPNATHAVHIHEYGDLSNGCMSLGGHYNPGHTFHGSRHDHERHQGDLINNFTTDARGEFNYEYVDYLAIEDLFGRSIVIHALQDDLGRGGYEHLSDKELIGLCGARGYKGLKTKVERINKLNYESIMSGNAGERITCAVIGRALK